MSRSDEGIARRATIERKDPSLPRFVVVPAAAVAGWQLDGTTIVEGTLNATALGRRSLKRWDDDRWFLDLPAAVCARAEVDTGVTVTLRLWRASTALATELETLLAADAVARSAWPRLSASRRRMISEHVRAAKCPATRTRRAERAIADLRAS